MRAGVVRVIYTPSRAARQHRLIPVRCACMLELSMHV
jgi:hypothetical protein